MADANPYNSRAAAKSQGASRYFTGIPCPHGHISERFTSNGRCCVCSKQARADWGAANQEALRIKYAARIQRNRKDYYERNRTQEIVNVRQWQGLNPHKVQLFDSRRRAARAKRLPQWYGELDDFVIEEAHNLTQLRARLCGGAWQVDHMFPLLGRKVSGLHCALNVQVIPATLNAQKRNHCILTEPFEWLYWA